VSLGHAFPNRRRDYQSSKQNFPSVQLLLLLYPFSLFDPVRSDYSPYSDTLFLTTFAMEDSARGYRELAPKPTSSGNSPGHPARPDIANQTPIQYSFKLVARMKPGHKKQHAASLITDAQKAATKTTTAVGRIVRNATVFNVRDMIEQAYHTIV
jgi:hypothetical protein